MENMDPIERFMDCRVVDMSGGELASYVRTYMSVQYNLDLPMDGLVERKIMDALIKRYPGGRAGRIVQWVMMHHKGRKDGEYVSTSVFSKGMKWYTDKMFMELQADDMRRKQTEVGSDKLKAAFADVESMA